MAAIADFIPTVPPSTVGTLASRGVNDDDDIDDVDGSAPGTGDTAGLTLYWRHRAKRLRRCDDVLLRSRGDEATPLAAGAVAGRSDRRLRALVGERDVDDGAKDDEDGRDEDSLDDEYAVEYDGECDEAVRGRGACSSAVRRRRALRSATNCFRKGLFGSENTSSGRSCIKCCMQSLYSLVAAP